MSDRMMFYIGASVFGLLGLLILYFCIDQIRETVTWLKQAQRVEALVLKVEEGTTSYRPDEDSRSEVVSATTVVTFQYNILGKQYEYVDNSSFLLKYFYKVGDKAQLLYQLNEPEKPRENHPFLLWGLSFSLLVFSLMLFGAALLLFKISK